jgi:hypothetical protein
MSWLQAIRNIRRERRIIKALTIIALEKAVVEEVLLRSRPVDCYGDDCNNCRCDLAPDCD